MSWTRLTLRVHTPLFGGEDPGREDPGTPVRVPSIRGALRFWFRAVAAGHGVSGLKDLKDLKDLWEAEEAVFGSTRTPSAIGLRVLQPATATDRNKKPDWATTEREGFDGAQYLLGQGLWKHGDGLRRPYVPRDEWFYLDIRFARDNAQTNARFMLALWAWLTYGGLGARTRRGFGQLVCTAVHGELPCGWTHAHLSPPATADDWHALGQVAFPAGLPGTANLGWGDPLPLPIPDDAPLPDFPTLAPRWWAGFMLDEEAASLGEMLHLAGLRWRRFRAADGSDDLDPGYKPDSSTRSPEWTNVIRGTRSRYPIAALGLPVGYFSRSGRRTSRPGSPRNCGARRCGGLPRSGCVR